MVPCANEKKAALQFLVEKALELGLRVDSDGMFEDRQEVSADKLRLEQSGEMLANPIVFHVNRCACILHIFMFPSKFQGNLTENTPVVRKPPQMG